MTALLLILIPVVAGVLTFFLKEAQQARLTAMVASIASLAILVVALTTAGTGGFSYTAAWLPQLGAQFALEMDGASKVLALLTVLAYPLILLATWNNRYEQPNQFFALLLLAQAGILGVFLAADGLLFYFFWELALIPVYFLCSRWGGERRIAATFKFFLYTFMGSLLMLVGLVYLYYQTPGGSFALRDLIAVPLSEAQQAWLFWMFFVAFAIKMPVFPFHTWQPDTYEQAPTTVTMVLSALMVKMGLFAVVRWLIPLFPEAASQYNNVVIGLSVVGMIYASLLALQQDDLKRLVAYSSIAHIGLMSAALFVNNTSGLQGAIIQFFSHGVNVLGLWIVIDFIEQRMGTRRMSELGGLAQKAPALAILLVVVALANVALPLTNAFIGEFLMFNGLFQFNTWYALVAGLSIILSAVYTLRMIQKVFFGATNERTEKAEDINWAIRLSLVVIAAAIFVMGVYPRPVFTLVNDTVQMLLAAWNG
ncbi:MAG: NuoM family protein [Lacibacter sp.]